MFYFGLVSLMTGSSHSRSKYYLCLRVQRVVLRRRGLLLHIYAENWLVLELYGLKGRQKGAAGRLELVQRLEYLVRGCRYPQAELFFSRVAWLVSSFCYSCSCCFPRAGLSGNFDFSPGSGLWTGPGG